MANVGLPAASPLGANRSPAKSNAQPNVVNVVLGNLHIRPWYPSFYPEELIGGKRSEWLYVCPYCFKYTGEIVKFAAHGKVCSQRDSPPPGNIVYKGNGYAIREFDGEEFKLYAQNLSLFSKLFLDTKSVFFDVGTFLYYTLIVRDPAAQAAEQVVGFFSKEKMSWDNNNLACILVFPPWQRKGLGQVLIAASYELGRREKRFGGPERPLSTLGRKGYIAFWCTEIYRFVLGCKLKSSITIQDISDGTYVQKDDIVTALKEMDILESRKTPSGSCVVNKSRVKEWAATQPISDRPVVDVNAFFKSCMDAVESDEDVDDSQSVDDSTEE